jgi:hypothetical protein
LPIAYCLLPIAYCLLPIAYCLFTIHHCHSLPNLKPLNKTIRYCCFRLCFLLFLFQPGHIPVVLWGKANFFFEKAAERSDAFKAYFIAYLCYGFIIGKHIPGFIQPFPGQVLMRSMFVYSCKNAVKMKFRKTGFSRYIIKPYRFVKIFIHERFRGDDTMIYIYAYLQNDFNKVS